MKNVNFTPAQMTFLFVVAGFVVYEVLSEWSASKTVLTWLPMKLMHVLEASGRMGSFLSASVMFFFYPAIFLLGIYLLIRLTSKTSLRRTASLLCVLLIPTMAAAHILKSFLKMTSRIPYWEHVFSDPIGVSTATQLSNKSIVLNKSIPDALYSTLSYVSILVMLVTLVGIIFLVKASSSFKAQELKVKAVIFCGAITYWGIFAVTIFLWRF
ncbi:hypothetical protein KA005_22065 [bacterium]|nr:hypothetical protein [bacterium]